MATLTDLLWPTYEVVADVAPRPWNELGGEFLEGHELLDVRLDPGRSTVGAMIIDGPDLRVVVARRVRAVSWELGTHDLPRLGDRFAREVGISALSTTPDGLLRWGLRVERGSDLIVTASEFACYQVHVDGLPDAPPDYTELDDAAIYLQRPDWTSPFRLLSWARRTADLESPSGRLPGVDGT
ncbi:hypothetical protein [Blastococcus sp. URHD0036]|uniref:hypothetical protein n=1 Tax=Blastococcus sp. URHD0036 TaxID=1380356 RepID=UPI0012DFB25E|nr:hypothetical protein [Blastococcus sp. URHD0036]